MITAYKVGFALCNAALVASTYMWALDKENSITWEYGTVGEESNSVDLRAVTFAASGFDSKNGLIYIYGGMFKVNGGLSSSLAAYNISSTNYRYIHRNQPDAPPNYGIFQIPSASSTPGARYFGNGFFSELKNSFYMGYGHETFSELAYADLWKFNVSSGLWTWISGPSGLDHHSSYGPYGVETQSSYPGSRGSAVCGLDHELDLMFLFGGFGKPDSGLYTDLSDVWRFNLTSEQWSLLLGATTGRLRSIYNTSGVYGASLGCIYAGAAQYDPYRKRLVLFGGNQCRSNAVSGLANDVWAYDIVSNSFAWLGGSKIGGSGNYGMRNVATPNTMPRSRCDTHIFVTMDSLYIFGGVFYTGTRFVYLNDLWEFRFEDGLFYWRSGSSEFGQEAVIETIYPSNENVPNSRAEGAYAYDRVHDRFYVVGGSGVTSGALRVEDSVWGLYNVSDKTLTTPATSATSGTVQLPIRNFRGNSKSESPISGKWIIAISISVGICLGIVVWAAVVIQRKRAKLRNLYSRSASKNLMAINAQDGEQNSITQDDQWSNRIVSNAEIAKHLSEPIGETTVVAELSAALFIPAYLQVEARNFRIQKQIAHGGEGSVHLAEFSREGLSSTVVIKVMDSNTENKRNAMLQEVSIMNLLSQNNNIAKLLGYCVEPLAIIMKFYKCGTLDNYILKKGRLSNKKTLHLLLDIASGVQAIHWASIAHCDIKSSNVLLDKEGNRLYAVITDFGIAAVLPDKQMLVKAFGVVNLNGLSCLYAAPEVFTAFRNGVSRSGAIYKAGDIYAFGCLIYELLVLVKPWK